MRADRRADSLWHKIEPLLLGVERPSRYINHEYNSVADHEYSSVTVASKTNKNLVDELLVLSEEGNDAYRVALLYPDTYEIGQSNLALSILYQQINAQQGFIAERAFLPWVDMIDLMRSHGIPLFTLENTLPVASCDLLGITLPHELAATNILEALDLAGIPLHAQDRSEGHPLILGGGPLAFNPEPLAAFFDAFVIGEGEEVILEIIQALKLAKARSATREHMLVNLAQIPGVYVPAFYKPAERDNSLIPLTNIASRQIAKRVITDFDTLPAAVSPIVPFTEATHDRLAIEIMRGCTRGCRFCQAGMIYRPVRERSADSIVAAAAHGLANTGFDEISLLSLSSTDHSQIDQILQRLNKLLAGTASSVSLPSQRLDAFGVRMAQLVAGERKAGLTFAPEAGTQRLRNSINKNVSDENLIDAMQTAFELGWRRCKLYFMLGLPTETDEDILSIAVLANRAFETVKNAVPQSQRGAVRMTISVAVFIPKPHTPYQWTGQISQNEIRRRIELLRSAGLHRGIDLHWHDPATSRIEAALSRAGRQAAALIEAAWRSGARFDAWSEQFDETLWLKAEEASGLCISELAERQYALDEALPWDHIDTGISRSFFKAEYQKSLCDHTTEDCSFGACEACDVCTALNCAIQLGGERRG